MTPRGLRLVPPVSECPPHRLILTALPMFTPLGFLGQVLVAVASGILVELFIGRSREIPEDELPDGVIPLRSDK